MTEILHWSSQNPLPTLVLIVTAGAVLFRLAQSLGELGSTVIEHHHHHDRDCEDDHEEGPCRDE